MSSFVNDEVRCVDYIGTFSSVSGLVVVSRNMILASETPAVRRCDSREEDNGSNLSKQLEQGRRYIVLHHSRSWALPC